MTNDVLKRAFDVQDSGGETKTVDGYAALFDVKYLMYKSGSYEVWEQVNRGAFDGADMSDVVMLYDHEGKVVARTANGTLELNIDEKGLKVRADLSKTEAAKTLYDEIKAGMITKMSFAFTPDSTLFDPDQSLREIRKIGKVYDVSAVAIPANNMTEIEARSLTNGLNKRGVALLKLKAKV